MFMRELTFEEMDQVAGGNIWIRLGELIIPWAAEKVLDFLRDNKDVILKSMDTYGAAVLAGANGNIALYNSLFGS